MEALLCAPRCVKDVFRGLEVGVRAPRAFVTMSSAPIPPGSESAAAHRGHCQLYACGARAPGHSCQAGNCRVAGGVRAARESTQKPQCKNCDFVFHDSTWFAFLGPSPGAAEDASLRAVAGPRCEGQDGSF